jgi:hypothetical protein
MKPDCVLSGTGNPGPRQTKWEKAMKFVRPLLLTIFLIGGTSLAAAQELTPVGHPEQLGFSATRLQRAMSIAANCRERYC